MENPTFQNILQDDFIMIQILKMLNLREQIEVQKVNRRFQEIIRNLVWSQDYKEVKMSSKQLALLSDKEFFEFLKWNAKNIEKLQIIEDDGSNARRYFPEIYEDLLELQIKGILLNDLEFDCIARKCPRLHQFEYNANRDSYDLEDKEFLQCLEFVQSYESFLKFRNLKCLILKDLLLKMSYEILKTLAWELQLEHFEWHNFDIKPLERYPRDVKDLHFPKLKILKIQNIDQEKLCWMFITRCPSLKELNCHWPKVVKLSANFFDHFVLLENLHLKGCPFMPAMERIMRLKSLRYINIGGELDEHFEDQDLTDLPLLDTTLLNTLSFLKLNLHHYPEDFRFLLVLLQKPKTILENLQILSLSNSAITDEFIWLLTLKCHHLKHLQLKQAHITGKYMDRLKKLQYLKLVKNKKPIPWSHLYVLMRDLLQLEYITLDDVMLTKDDWQIKGKILNFGDSWKFLKITQLQKQMEFWLYLLNFLYEGFRMLQTVHIAEYTSRNLEPFLCCFPKIPQLILKTCPKLYKNCRNLMMLLNNSLRELTLIDCKHLTWLDIVSILYNSKVKNFRMFKMPSIKVDYITRQPEDYEIATIVKNLQSITIPFEIFSQTWETWQEISLNCPHFRLCCMGQYCQDIVLDMLLDTDELKRKVKAVYSNAEIETLKRYCTANLNLATKRVPVYLLDEQNKLMWNSHYSKDNGDLIIIIDL